MRIGICDDDQQYLAYFETLMEEYAAARNLELEVTAAENGEQLLETAGEPLDTVFLDMELRSGNGIELAETINRRWKKCKVVYLTNYLLYATDVYRTEHIYFVLKDELSRRLDEVFQKIIEENMQESAQMVFRIIGEKERFFSLSEIYYFERKRRKTCVYTREGEFYIWEKLDEIAERLPSHIFVRCHNSYIVSLAMIREMHMHSFLMENGTDVPISRSRLAVTREAFGQWALSRTL